MNHSPIAIDANYAFEDPYQYKKVKDLAELAHSALRVVGKSINGIKLIVDSTSDAGTHTRLTIEKPAGDKNVIAYEIALIEDGVMKNTCIGGAFSLTHSPGNHSWMFPRAEATDRSGETEAFKLLTMLFTRLIGTSTQFLVFGAPIPRFVTEYRVTINGDGYSEVSQ